MNALRHTVRLPPFGFVCVLRSAKHQVDVMLLRAFIRLQQLLDHMNESSSFTEADLKPFRARLNELRSIVTSDKESGKHPEAMTKLLERNLNGCGEHQS